MRAQLTQYLHTLLQTPDIYWNLLAAAIALALGGAAKAWLTPKLQHQENRWRVASEALSRIVFPLASLMVVLLGQGALHSAQLADTLLDTLLMPALTTLTAIHLLIYLLRYIFGPTAWVARSERWLFWVLWGLFFLHVTGLLDDFITVLNRIGFSVGKHQITAWLILNGVFMLVGTLLITLWLGSMLEKRVMQTQSIDLNLRVVLTKIIRAALLLVGFLIALPLVGIDLTALSVFSGALGVGIGFGLQKIASNYVAGFIILLDRSIRLGDSINVDGRQGIVQKLTSRYVVLSPAKGAPVTIIPTEALISSTVVNQTYASDTIRINLPIQIAYESDLATAERILLAAAQAQTRVLADPAPVVFLKNFGESGIDLELSVCIRDPENGELGLRSDINRAIWAGFQTNGIEIPYPKREVRVCSASTDDVARHAL